MSQTTTKTRGSHFRDLLIAGLIGFTIASILFTLGVITYAAASHPADCAAHL